MRKKMTETVPQFHQFIFVNVYTKYSKHNYYYYFIYLFFKEKIVVITRTKIFGHNTMVFEHFCTKNIGKI